MAVTVRGNGYRQMIVPEADADEAVLIPDPEIISVKMLPDLFHHLSGRR